MDVKRLGVWLILSAGILTLALLVAACGPSGGQAKPVAFITPASAPSLPAAPVANAGTASNSPAGAKTPVAILRIVPVAANAADPNVVIATLPGTTSTLPLGASGLPNVTIGMPVTLKGATVDPKAPAKTYTWTLTRPSNSKAALSKSDAEVVKFTPDVSGIYKADLIVKNEGGTSPLASVQIHAGKYIGVEKGDCKTCHIDEAKGWADTGHATKLKREIDGSTDPANSRYAETCLRCHTVGYYLGVDNGGFVEMQARTGWKFPSLASIQSGKGNWDAIPADLKNVSNIQCENCHGPAKDHVDKKAPMAKSLDEGVCNVCHNGGGTHVKGAMFANSVHGDKSARAWNYPTGPDRQDCVRCHSGKGYISFLENPTEKASWDSSPQTVTCGVCHNPHSNANKYQLRIVGKAVEANGVTRDFGLSATCAECHNARTQPGDAQRGVFPHYSAAAEMLSNSGGVEYDEMIADTPHNVVGSIPVANPSDPTGKTKLFGGNIPGPCVNCHMWPTPPDKDPNRFKVGDHSFNTVSPDSEFQYTASCLAEKCHPGLKDFNIVAKGDYDGNGKTETVQAELAGLLKVLQKAIADSGVKPVEVHPYFDANDVAKANPKQKNAIYNYFFVRGVEGADGRAAAMHNFKRSVTLLQLSYKDLTGKAVPKGTIME